LAEASMKRMRLPYCLLTLSKEITRLA